MKKKIIYIFVLVIGVIITLQALRIKTLTEQNERNERNATALLEDVQHYRTADSLNAIKTAVLSLKISELEKYRAEDIKTIETLKIKRKELEQVTTMQTRTIADLKGRARDTIVIVDSVEVVRMQCVDVADKWIDLHGCIDPEGDFSGTLEVRDSLLIVETIQRKRFLGFLWKTKRIKSRTIDATSRNPYTEIVGVESIQIEG